MLKINVGFNRKVGEPNYSSRGASVNLELEADSSLVGDPDRLRERVRQMFLLAKGSVDEELNAPRESGDTVANPTPTRTGENVNQPPQRRRDGTRPATASQVRAINAIADRQQCDLNLLLHERHGIESPADLTISEASQLIDELKALGNCTFSGPSNGAQR